METELITRISELNSDYEKKIKVVKDESSVEMTKYIERLEALNEEVSAEVAMGINSDMTPEKYDEVYNASVDSLEKLEKLYAVVQDRETELNTDDYHNYAIAWDVVSEKNRETLVALNSVLSLKRNEFEDKQSKIDENNEKIANFEKEFEDFDRIISRHEREIQRLEAKLQFIENTKNYNYSDLEKDDIRQDIDHHRARIDELKNLKQHDQDLRDDLTKENEEIYKNFNAWDYRFQQEITEAKKAANHEQERLVEEDRKKRDEERKKIIRKLKAEESRAKKKQQPDPRLKGMDNDMGLEPTPTEPLIDIEPRPTLPEIPEPEIPVITQPPETSPEPVPTTSEPTPTTPEPTPTTPEPTPTKKPEPVEAVVVKTSLPKSKLINGIGMVLFGAAAFLSSIGIHRIADKLGLMADKLTQNNVIDDNININTTVETEKTYSEEKEDEKSGDELSPSDETTNNETITPEQESEEEPEKDNEHSDNETVDLKTGDFLVLNGQKDGTDVRVEIDSDAQKSTTEGNQKTINGEVTHTHVTYNGEDYTRVELPNIEEEQTKVKGVNYEDFQGTDAEKANAAEALITGQPSSQAPDELFAHNKATDEIDNALNSHSLFHHH